MTSKRAEANLQSILNTPLWRWTQKNPKGTLGDMAKYIEDLENLIMKSTPLAWATGKFNDDAYAWEKEAHRLLKLKG